MDSTRNPGVVNEQSISSPENLTIHAFDGRVVTRNSVSTQSETGQEQEGSQDDEYSIQEASKAPPENLGLTDEQPSVSSSSKDPEDGLQRQTPSGSVPKNMESELEISPDNEVLGSFVKETPQTPAACQEETEVSLTNLDEISYSSGSESPEESSEGPSEKFLQIMLDFFCEYCKKLKKPRVNSLLIANSFDPSQYFCCVKAWELSRGFLEAAKVITGETVTDGYPEMEEDEGLDDFEFEMDSDHPTPKAGHKHRVSFCLQDRLADAWTAMKDDSFPEIEIMDSENTFSFSGTNAAKKRTAPFVRHYNNGQTFIVIFPDGTGQVWYPSRYPSGRLAILLAAQPATWWCMVVLEDNHLQPRVQAVFTNRGQSTCYHNNGCIWVNLAPWGGTYCSDTGDLKKDWDWLDNMRHVHAPPIQPLYVKLSPNINIRFQSQEHICITFISGEQVARLNVGANLKLSQPDQGKGLTLPGLDTLQRYLQQKSAEINALLQNIQSLIAYQKTVSRRKVKPQ